MASVTLEGVSKRFGAIAGVERLDLAVRDEEFMVFLGPSGCGKTTTMRMVAGLIEPSEGVIRIAGEPVNDVQARDRDVAMVFQSYALYPNMSVYENIRFPLRMRGVPRAQQDAQVRRAAEMVEIAELLDRKPRALSGGQRQRAALARAVVRRPRLFLMDEPLSNLDAKLRTAMRAQLKHVQRELRITTIYVTHDQIEAMTLADRIAVMEGGRIRQLGTPDEIYADPADLFVAGFVGSPPMNLIEGRVAGGVFEAPGCRVEGVAVRDGPATLGVRPEDARVMEDGAAHLAGPLYALEPMGDQTLLGVGTTGALFTVKEGRDFRRPLDVETAVRFDPTRLYAFDPKSGARLRRA